MTSPRILFFSGSTRDESLNKKLARNAWNIATAMDVDATYLDLRDYPMPIYNGDIEAESGLPAAARELKAEFVAHDGFFIASPEYNSSFSPLLKNSLDWISRPHEKDEGSLIAYRGKVAALSAASPGGFGGLRGLVPLRMMLGNIGVHLIPDQLAISAAHKAFDDEGKLTNPQQLTTLQNIITQLVRTSVALKS